MKKILFMYEFTDLGYELIEHAGVECLAAYMQEHNWDIDIINIIYESDRIEPVNKFCPDILAISVTTPNITNMMELAKQLKSNNPNMKIVVGGVGASVEPKQIIEDYDFIDAVIIGEGEESLLEVSEALYNNELIDDIKGICYKKNDQIVLTKARELISNINILPEVAHIAYHKYKDNKNLKYIALSTTRGCLGNCSFCERNFRNQKGAVIRNRSAKNVVDEIEHCIEKYNVHRFCFIDQTFEDSCPIGKERIENIADLIIERNLDIVYTIHIRTENWHESDLSLIKKLRKSGLTGIYPGIESAEDYILKNIYNKHARVADHIRTIDLFKQIDVALDIGLIMFNPYVTIEQLQTNFEFIKNMNLGHLAHIYFNKLIIFPGTEILCRIRKDNLLIVEPSYRNFQKAQYAYKFVDDRVKYINENILTDKNLDKLKVHDLYMLSIDWDIFISTAKLKLLNEKYKNIIDMLVLEDNNMKKHFQKILNPFFESVLLAGINRDNSNITVPELNEDIDFYKNKFSKLKFKLFKEVLDNKDDFILKFYNY